MARFLHSGKYGDLVYALWAIKAAGGGQIWFNMTEGSLCTEKDYDFCKPLLQRQSFVHGVHKITFGQNLSNQNGTKMFCRQDVQNPDFLILDNAWWWRYISKGFPWIYRYGYQFGVHVDGALAVLEIERHKINWEDRKIVVNFTDRYRAREDSFYDSLRQRPDVIRIGDRPELGDQQCADMLEMATLIADSKFFIGNCSCCNALAQSLQHPRLIETEYEYGDANPIGSNFLEVTDDLDGDVQKMLEISKGYWDTYAF